MKRLHVHVSVKDLDASIRFYSHLFASDPAVRKEDYAKWMLDDPRVNFAISSRDGKPGVQHLGIQVENRRELTEVYERLQRAERPVIEEGATVCCYAQSEKRWIDDPQGVQWETFLTTGESTEYGTDEIRFRPREAEGRGTLLRPVLLCRFRGLTLGITLWPRFEQPLRLICSWFTGSSSRRDCQRET